VAVLDMALGQIPAEYVEALESLVRADSAGATHGLVDCCREARMRFSVGYELTEPVSRRDPSDPRSRVGAGARRGRLGPPQRRGL
jgi:hypothetical protein